ncbi:MAG: hypothetical protein H6843_02270 [Rhodospirillaceae bacterium]|nr:hypothetical protein [Rhodospirillaceae bacterium]
MLDAMGTMNATLKTCGAERAFGAGLARRAPLRAIAALAGSLALGACSGTADFGTEVASIGAGALAGGLTGNPLIGFAVGAGTQIAFSEGVDYYNREAVRLVQDAIAAEAGEAPEGESRTWAVESDVPLVDATGQVQVLRDFGGDIACRQIVFTDEDIEDMYFVTVICRGDNGTWYWANAEPAVDRWDGIQ